MALDSSLSVLVFTENRKTADWIASVLGKLGLNKVTNASTAKEAASAVSQGKGGLVVAEHTGEGKAVHSLIKTLRDSAKHRATPILLIAGTEEKALAGFAAKDPKADFLAKPLSAKAFAQKLAGLVQKKPQPGPAGKNPAPEPASASSREALALLRAGKVNEAKGHFTKLLKEHGPFADLSLGLALAHALAGEKEQVNSVLDSLIETRPDLPQKDAATTKKTDPAEPAEDLPEGEVNGIWRQHKPKERRQKAYEHFQPSHDKREVFRLFAPDWSAGFSDKKGTLQMVDISFGGCAFEAPRPALERGQKLGVDIYRDQEKVLESIPATVMRVEPEVVGVRFDELERRQEAFLNEKLREEQKKGAATSQEFQSNAKDSSKVIKLSL
ncbi:PilZ domain-containing protein [Desulfohalovibrio reitneri]|uniref:PilZ domain-containing protein n=1 Tax=Desulfohalovibrio reitneri TaxID=1307759 RepID=UPI0004A6C0EE|nr:PilZ domain-containing protein [Desulfohalovibrio reitneri]